MLTRDLCGGLERSKAAPFLWIIGLRLPFAAAVTAIVAASLLLADSTGGGVMALTNNGWSLIALPLLANRCKGGISERTYQGKNILVLFLTQPDPHLSKIVQFLDIHGDK